MRIIRFLLFFYRQKRKVFGFSTLFLFCPRYFSFPARLFLYNVGKVKEVSRVIFQFRTYENGRILFRGVLPRKEMYIFEGKYRFYRSGVQPPATYFPVSDSPVQESPAQ